MSHASPVSRQFQSRAGHFERALIGRSDLDSRIRLGSGGKANRAEAGDCTRPAKERASLAHARPTQTRALLQKRSALQTHRNSEQAVFQGDEALPSMGPARESPSRPKRAAEPRGAQTTGLPRSGRLEPWKGPKAIATISTLSHAVLPRMAMQQSMSRTYDPTLERSRLAPRKRKPGAEKGGREGGSEPGGSRGPLPARRSSPART